MNELVNKISSYHIFNYLVPGVIFSYFIDNYFDWPIELIQSNILVAFFIYYFIGATINRIGSVILLKIIILIFKIQESPYSDYLEAEKIDPKITILSEINNMYRSFFSLFFILLVLSIINLINTYSQFNLFVTIIFLSLLVLYGFSCKKQTNFIRQRVNNAIKKS